MNKKKAKKKDKKIIQRVIVIVSGMALLSYTIYALVLIANNSPSASEDNNEQLSTSIEQQLEEQAQGYELVLEGEPDNRFALESLVRVSVQLNDYQRALEPMTKLVELYPNNGEYQIVLQQIQNQLNPPLNEGITGETEENNSESE